MAGRKPTGSMERFAEKCKPVASRCVEWTGGTTQNGYGLFSVPSRTVRGRMMSAHRWLFEQAYGKQPASIDVCHSCDNRKCVNIAHLFAGTRKQNMEDAVRKGRTSHVARVKGEKHPNRRLTAAQAKEVRALRLAGCSLRFVSGIYGISVQQVCRIALNQSWKEES